MSQITKEQNGRFTNTVVLKNWSFLTGLYIYTLQLSTYMKPSKYIKHTHTDSTRIITATNPKMHHLTLVLFSDGALPSNTSSLRPPAVRTLPQYFLYLHANLISRSTSTGNDFAVQAVRCGVDKEGGRRAVSDHGQSERREGGKGKGSRRDVG